MKKNSVSPNSVFSLLSMSYLPVAIYALSEVEVVTLNLLFLLICIRYLLMYFLFQILHSGSLSSFLIFSFLIVFIISFKTLKQSIKVVQSHHIEVMAFSPGQCKYVYFIYLEAFVQIVEL